MKIKNYIEAMAIIPALFLAAMTGYGEDLQTKPITSIDVQQDLLMDGAAASLDGAATSATSNDAELDIEIIAMFPEIQSIPSIQFEGKRKITYSQNGGSILVDCGTIKPIYSSIEGVPDAFKPLTIGIGCKEKVEVEVGSGDLKVSPVDIEVSIYRKPKGEISPSTKPDLELTLKHTNLQVKDFDPEKGHVVLEWSAHLPRSGNSIFDQYLAGKEILATTTVDKI